MRRCRGEACAMPIPEVATHCPRCAIKERRRRRRKSQRSGEVASSSEQTRIDWSGSPRDQLNHWRNYHSAPPNLDKSLTKTRPKDEEGL